MERIPEPELMDAPEHVDAYHKADFSEPHTLFVEHFKKRFPDFHTGHVLDLGCGTCDVVIRFAKAFPETSISCVDGSQAMLDIASSELKRHGLHERVTLIKAYLPNHRIMNKRYDAVISNSLLHHLKEPAVLWRIIKCCAKDGAPVFNVDLLRPESVEEAKEIVKKYASGESPLLQEDFFNSLRASYNVREIENQLRSEGIVFLNIDVISDRHVAIWGRFRS